MSKTSPPASPPHGRVTVLGSANLDLIIETVRLPRPGETVPTRSRRYAPGGKGLNQAVAASRAGATVAFIGAVGTDPAGEQLHDHLRRNAVDTADLLRVEGESGSAIVLVEDSGENAILVTAGANGQVRLLPPHKDRWLDSNVLLMQLELPMTTIQRAAHEAQSHSTRVILNAAPPLRLPTDILELIDVLIVNEHECRELAPGTDIEQAARHLARAVPVLVVTLGAHGVLWFEHGRQQRQLRPPRVNPVDTTGAGDTFCGAFAAQLAIETPIEQALGFAVTASALSIETEGASDSAPHRDDVLARHQLEGTRRDG